MICDCSGRAQSSARLVTQPAKQGSQGRHDDIWSSPRSQVCHRGLRQYGRCSRTNPETGVQPLHTTMPEATSSHDIADTVERPLSNSDDHAAREQPKPCLTCG